MSNGNPLHCTPRGDVQLEAASPLPTGGFSAHPGHMDGTSPSADSEQLLPLAGMGRTILEELASEHKISMLLQQDIQPLSTPACILFVYRLLTVIG